MRRPGSHAAPHALWLALLLALPAGAQNRTPMWTPSPPMANPPQTPNNTNNAHVPDQLNDVNLSPNARIWRGQDYLRQKEMASDVDKLLKLTSELNAEISNSNSDSLTEAQLRKVGEIEKLARSIKEKMNTPVQPRPRIM